jgi:uncharacterized membrane protein YphA (DoxX/SURF4 family)
MQIRTIVNTLLRWVVGATFLFSGFTKCVDPVGISIYVEKYLATYSLEALLPLSGGISVALAVVETLLGALLITGALRCVTTLATLVVVALFTIITLLSATVLPIGECGCFGDIILLTPWQTLLKNVLLLVLCIVLWRRREECKPITLFDVVVVVVGIVAPLGVSMYAFRHMPLVDSMPYKVGVALYDDVVKERREVQEAVQHVLVFRDKMSGDIVEFDAQDGGCWDDDNLEFVDAKVVERDTEERFADFRLYDADGEDCTLDILGRRGRVALLCVNDACDAGAKHLRGIESLLQQYPKYGIVVVSAVGVEDLKGVIGDVELDIVTIDAMTLRSVIRSDIGVVVLHDGVVEFKADIRDI